MGELSDARIAVVGAGVVGLCVALELVERGAAVTLIDADPEGNASQVAAGMIAPAFEAATDAAGEGRLDLFRAWRDLWPEVAGGTVRLHRDGALWMALDGDNEAEIDAVAESLRREGAQAARLSRADVAKLAPDLVCGAAGAVFSAEDWRLDPAAATGTLMARVRRGGGRWRQAPVRDVSPRSVALRDAVLEADAVILCAGWGARAFADRAPELASLKPIKGELVRYPGAEPRAGPTVRTRAGYLVPGEAGVVVGASMEAGVSDRSLTPEVQAGFARLAGAVYPGLRGASFVGAAGVRAATSDGLPLVGRSESGVWLATGFRRNGWLLAPLAARITADLVAGRDPGPWAAPMRPGRFSPA